MAEEKRIIDYKIFFKKSLDKSGDFLTLKVTFNTDLKELLKEIVIKEKTDFSCYLGVMDSVTGDRVYNDFKRYLVKSVYFSGISSDYRECLFIIDLIDRGEFTFKVGSIQRLDALKDSFKQSFKKIISLWLDCKETIEETTFRISKN